MSDILLTIRCKRCNSMLWEDFLDLTREDLTVNVEPCEGCSEPIPEEHETITTIKNLMDSPSMDDLKKGMELTRDLMKRVTGQPPHLPFKDISGGHR